MNDFKILNASNEECGFIDDQIVKYNISKVPFTQEPSFMGLNKVIKNEEGNVIAGILGVLYSLCVKLIVRRPKKIYSSVKD